MNLIAPSSSYHVLQHQTDMKRLILVGTIATLGLFAGQAKQDAKNAGNETKEAAKDAGRAVKHGTKKTTHAVKKGVHKGAAKVEQKTTG